jgi:hypothetical protein
MKPRHLQVLRWVNRAVFAGIFWGCTALPALAQFASGGGSAIGGPVGSGGTATATTGGGTGGGAGGGGGGGGTGATGSGSSSLIMGGSSMGSVTTSGGGRGATSTTIGSPISSSDFMNKYYASPTAAGQSANISLQPQESLPLTGVNIGTQSTTAGSTTPTATTNNLNAILTNKGAFGSPQYKNLYYATTTTNATSNNTQTAGSGFTTIGVKRTPQFSTAVTFKQAPGPSLEGLRESLQDALRQSTSLTSGQNLSVRVDGQTLVLTGTVATARERRVAEGIVLLTPGVPSVRNEITVVPNPQ